MALEDADIILGKIAIGRTWLSRDDAVRVAQVLLDAERRGRREPFHSAAVRLGMLERARADELARLLESGELVCRGRCGRRVRLALLSPRDSVACATCGGPVYVAPAGNGAAHPLAAVDGAEEAQSEEERPVGRRTVMDLAVEGVTPAAAPPPLPLPTPVPAPKKKTTSVHTVPALDPPPGDQRTFAGPEPAPEDGERTQEWDGPDTRAPGTAGPGDKTWRAAPGEALFEPFALAPDLQVLAPIGSGGMGNVYRGKWKGQVVAVKVLKIATEDPEVLARFEREVRASGRLSHPNVVRVLSTGRAGPGPAEGRPYYVMDYVQGRDLAAWAELQPRSVGECVRMVVVLCQAMEHVHSRGVIHRDLKPGNVLVRESDGQPTICDFGLAKYKAEVALTRPGDILGTPSYMPPEQALGNRTKIGPPTDVYALGALLYHLLTRRPPFSGPSVLVTIKKVVELPPEPPRKLNPAVGAELERVILKALAKEPIDRFHTCADLRKALEGVPETKG